MPKEIKVPAPTADRVNASNYDVADMLRVIKNEPVTRQVEPPKRGR